MDGGLVLQESQPFRIKGKEDLKPAEASYKGQTYKIKRTPSEREYNDMLFGWYVESGVNSNLRFLSGMRRQWQSGQESRTG